MVMLMQSIVYEIAIGSVYIFIHGTVDAYVIA